MGESYMPLAEVAPPAFDAYASAGPAYTPDQMAMLEQTPELAMSFEPMAAYESSGHVSSFPDSKLYMHYKSHVCSTSSRFKLAFDFCRVRVYVEHKSNLITVRKKIIFID